VYKLPEYKTINGCPIERIEQYSDDTFTSRHGALPINPGYNSGYHWYFKAIGTSVQTNTFYTKVTAFGGSSKTFGPYTWEMGCSADWISITDNADTSKRFKVGATGTHAEYVFDKPTTDETHCGIVSSELVTSDETTWSDSVLSMT
jgi:hypothetical protein